MPVFLFGQTQIGEDIEGEEIGEELGTSVSISENINRIIVGNIHSGKMGSAPPGPWPVKKRDQEFRIAFSRNINIYQYKI